MNIAIIISSLQGGGAERVAQIIGNYYVEKGNHVYYFLEDNGAEQVYPVKGKVINTGIKHCSSDNPFGDIQALARLVKASFRMRSYKIRYKIDVAISFIEESNYINILSRGREKIITRSCIILSQCSACFGIMYNKKLVRFFYNRAGKVVVLCDDAIEDMHRNYGIPLKRLIKIPNPVLAPPIYDHAEEWKYGDKVIVSVGRLDIQKQHDRIIRAFSYVFEQEKESRLLILGVGPMEKYLKGLCTRYHLEDAVIFAGFQKDIAYYLQNSKVYVMASEAEGMPNSMLEAMVNGLPVVTTDSPGACGELVGKRGSNRKCAEVEYCPYGILTPHISGKVVVGSALEHKEILLGQAMLELIRNEELCERYSERSHKRASMYCIERIMNKWNQLIK